MTKQPRTQVLDTARQVLESTMDYDGLLEKLSPKDRQNVTRHIEACEAGADPRHAGLWKRIAGTLMGLAPHFAKTDGQQRVRFFVRDGQYRMQVFALEDLRDGIISIYCGDALDEAVEAGLLTPRKGLPTADSTDPVEFSIAPSNELLAVARLNNQTHVPAPFYKDMLGWNRRALCIRLPATASAGQAEAVRMLAALSLVRAGKPAAASEPGKSSPPGRVARA